MSAVDLASELRDAYAARRTDVIPPSAREGGIDLAAAYLVEAEHVRERSGQGRVAVGLKVGYANKAMWRALKLDTLVWARMYDNTVRHAADNSAALSIDRMTAPKIEPEIVFKLAAPVPEGAADAAAVLESVEWLALGFEIIDSVYVDWKFQPVDFVASFGLHAALVVGEPLRVEAGAIPDLVDALASFKVRLSKGEVVAEGSGRNSLKSPALCLGELATAVHATSHTLPLAAGDLVSSGTLTESQFIAAGDIWTAAVEGLNLPPLTMRVEGK